MTVEVSLTPRRQRFVAESSNSAITPFHSENRCLFVGGVDEVALHFLAGCQLWIERALMAVAAAEHFCDLLIVAEIERE